MNITIYSTTTCSSCHVLTEWLDKQGLSYIKRNTDEDAAAMETFMEVNDGYIGVPFTVITQDDGQETKIGGYDLKAFKQILAY